jgi:hypothetical protein
LATIHSFIPGHITLNKAPSLVPMFCHVLPMTGRRDATCSITAEATHTGGGEIQYLSHWVKKLKAPGTPVSPGRARLYFPKLLPHTIL